MKAFHLMHQSLDAIGNYVGQITLYFLAVALLVAPICALLIGSGFAAINASNFLGGGPMVTVFLFFVFVGLVGVYVAPHTLPQIGAAFSELAKSEKP